MTECRAIVRGQASKVAEDVFRERIEKLASAATEIRHSLLIMAERCGWDSGRYDSILAPRNVGEHYRVFCDREDQRAANYANYLSGMLMVNRILLAVRPSMQWLEQKNRKKALEIQYIHAFVKSDNQLRNVYLVHSERVALAVLLTSGYWKEPRGTENARAYDSQSLDGGRIIDQWKFDAFDDVLCARKIDAPLM